VTDAEISKHGSLPTVAPVNPYTLLALILSANCLPSNTARLNGSFSFLRSARALARALKSSSRIQGKMPFLTDALTNMSIRFIRLEL